MIAPTNTLDDFQRVIAGSQIITVTTHKNPDADALGSTQALTEALRALGKTVHPVTSDADPIPEKTHCLIYLDTPTADRAVTTVQSFRNTVMTVSVDHHRTPKPFADINIIAPHLSSTAEILFYIFEKNLSYRPDPKVATWLLAGIVGDTRSFQHALHNPETLRVAARLMSIYRGDLQKATALAFGDLNQKTLRLMGKALMRTRLAGSTAYAVLDKKELTDQKLTNNNYDEIIALVNSVAGARMALLLCQKTDTEVSVSLRSEAFKKADVRLIAEDFGGGGHPYAAGFKIPGRLMHTAKGWSIKKLDQIQY